MIEEILWTKRDGGLLTREQCAWLMPRVGRGEVDEAQLTALLASIWHLGMEPGELSDWTGAMVDSGGRFDLSRFDAPKVDKHSTGGVGDKVSLPLAPILASLGCVVPMISGRGLGHTGGTLDKLEAVPGVRTELDEAAVMRVLEEAGCVICAQTKAIAPADRVMYALRDRVQLVESLPLIASSIVSKKIAEDIDALVLDVKAGSGAFLVDPAQGRKLAQSMVDLAHASGVKASARMTWMGRPLGRAVGHALEIEETRATLRGEGPADLMTLVTAFAADLITSVDLAPDRAAAEQMVQRAVVSGSALEVWEAMLRAQGATGAACEAAPDVHEVLATGSGALGFDDVRAVGHAVKDLGGGRALPGDVIDPAVGIVFSADAGDAVESGDVLATIHHRGGQGLDAALNRLGRTLQIAEDAPPQPALLLERILPT